MNSLDVLSSSEVAGLFLYLHEFIVMRCGDGGLSRLTPHHWCREFEKAPLTVTMFFCCWIDVLLFQGILDSVSNICSCQNKHILDPKLKNLSPDECWQSYLSAFMMADVVFWKGYEAQRALSEPLPLPSPFRGRLKHWLHVLWTYFPCLYLWTCRYKCYIHSALEKLRFILLINSPILNHN